MCADMLKSNKQTKTKLKNTFVSEPYYFVVLIINNQVNFQQPSVIFDKFSINETLQDHRPWQLCKPPVSFPFNVFYNSLFRVLYPTFPLLSNSQ